MSALAAISEPRRSLYPWLLTILLLLAFLLNYLDRQVIFAIFPLLQTDFGLSAVQLGSLEPPSYGSTPSATLFADTCLTASATNG